MKVNPYLKKANVKGQLQDADALHFSVLPWVHMG